MQQCNQVGVANCVACSLPDKTLIIPPAPAATAVIPMPGSLSFKLTIKKKLHLVGLPRPALVSSVFALVERLSMAIAIWRLVTTAAFIASRRTLRFKWTASARFRRSSLFPFPHSPAASAALLLLLSALLARCRFSRIATWFVPFANLYAGHDNSLSYPASGFVCPVSRVQSQPAALVIYVA